MKEWKRLLAEEDGMGVVEVVLIIVVLVAMVYLFKGKISTLVSDIWTAVTKQSKEIYTN